MPRFYRVFALGIAILVVVFTLIMVSLQLIPDDTFKGWIADGVKSATGRTLTIGDGFSLDIGRSIKVKSNNIKLANSGWGAQPWLFTVDKLETEVRIWPLLFGVVELTLRANKPKIMLERDKSGRGNWQFGDPIVDPNANGDSSSSFKILPKNIEINNTFLSYYHSPTTEPKTLEFDTIQLGPVENDFHVNLHGHYNEFPITIRGNLGALEKIQTGKPTDILIDAQTGNISLSARGTLADIAHPPNTTANVILNLRAPSTKSFNSFTKHPIPDFGAVEMQGVIKAKKGIYAAEDLVLSVSGKHDNANIKGAVADLEKFQGTELTGHFKTTQLATILKSFGIELPASLPQSLEGRGDLRSKSGGLTIENLEVKILDAGFEGSVTGEMEDILKQRRINAEFTISADSLSNLSGLTQTKLPSTAPIELRGRAVTKSFAAGVIEINAKIRSKEFKNPIEVKANIDRKPAGAELSMELAAATIADIGYFGGLHLGPEGPVNMRIKLNQAQDRIRAEDIKLTIGDSNLSGHLDLTLAKKPKPGNLEGRLESQFMDLNKILGASESTNEKQSAANVAVRSPNKLDRQSSSAIVDKVFSTEPLPVGILGQYNTNIELVAKQVHIKNLKIEDATAVIEMQGNKLILNMRRARVGDRPIQAGVSFDMNQASATLDVHLDVDQVPLSSLLAPSSILQGGNITLNVRAIGSGKSLGGIMGSLNGHITFAVRGSRIPHSFISQFGEGILSKINPLAEKSDHTNLDCGAIHLDIKDGIAKTPRGLAFQTTEVTWTGGGKIDLKTEQIDLRASSEARKGLGISIMGSLAKLVQLSGPIADPVLLPDPVGLAKLGSEIGFVVATGGLSLLLEKIRDRIHSKDDLCKQILKDIVTLENSAVQDPVSK